MLRVIAAQQPRSARPDRHAARQRFDNRDLKLGTIGKTKIIIGSEIVANSERQAPTAPRALRGRRSCSSKPAVMSAGR